MFDLRNEEKKVEYTELIYDLIFVYLVGRNNSLLHVLEDGFIRSEMLLPYILCTLVIIQIWSFTTFYINRYGRNGLRDHVFMFINMYLLYYMAEGTRQHWQSYVNEYNIAWALILLNLGLQYVIELRNHREAPWECKQIKRTAAIIWGEALIILTGVPLYMKTGLFTAPVAILFGIVGTLVSSRVNHLVNVDFAHLSERAMLYVVFTFGEMIIAISGYFKGGFSPNTLYYSTMSFLIVVSLFLSYGRIYDHIIDREMNTDGCWYIVLHIFLIFALNSITTSLEFMREEEVALVPKTIFLISSLLMYYVFLFLTERYAKERLKPNLRFFFIMGTLAVSFVVLMWLFREIMYINIALTVAYGFAVFLILYHYGEKIRE